MLLKTTSDLLLHAQALQQVRWAPAEVLQDPTASAVLRGACACHVATFTGPSATVLVPNSPSLQPKVPHRLMEDAGKTNSVDSSSTAAGQTAAAHTLLHDSATASLLPPLRQISLDIIAASELNRAKGLGPLERQNIFQDVFNEVCGGGGLQPAGCSQRLA